MGGAVFLASFLPASRWRGDDYHGPAWRFVKDAPKGEGGMLRHSLRWIRTACLDRGLHVEPVRNPVFDFGGQIWLRIRFANV